MQYVPCVVYVEPVRFELTPTTDVNEPIYIFKSHISVQLSVCKIQKFSRPAEQSPGMNKNNDEQSTNKNRC